MKQNPKVAVIGCGHWGKNLVRNFGRLDSLAMISEVSPSAVANAHRMAPDIPIVSDVEDVWLSDVDAVVIATPAETHFQLAKQALEAGKDVFVEKPLAINYDDAAHLVELAESFRRILMVGHVLEYHPGVKCLMTLISDGGLGKVRYIYSNRLSLGQIRREENILWSFAPHDVAVILRITGTLPFQVIACGGGYVQPNIADVTVTNLLFNNGVRAHIHVSWIHPFKEQRLVVVGSRKMASFDDVAKKLVLFDQRVEVKEGEPIPVKGKGVEIPFSQEEPLLIECAAFLQAVTTRQPPLTDGRSGLNVVQVLQAAQRSLIMNGQQETVMSRSSVDNLPHGQVLDHSFTNGSKKIAHDACL